MVYIVLICIVAPMLLMLFLLEDEARTIVSFMISGLFMCIFAYEINSLFERLLALNNFAFTTTVTPITEEIIKALPVIFFACFISDKTNRILSISIAVGVGFAILENVYLLTSRSAEINLFVAIIRGFSTGLMHGITTAAVGYGLSFVRKKKKLFFTGTFGLLSAAITYHAIYNMLVQSNLDYIGFVIPIATYIPFLIKLNRSRKNNLKL